MRISRNGNAVELTEGVGGGTVGVDGSVGVGQGSDTGFHDSHLSKMVKLLAGADDGMKVLPFRCNQRAERSCNRKPTTKVASTNEWTWPP